MATRTKYRRTRTGVAFGGAFWRFDPASQTPGGGGASVASAGRADVAAGRGNAPGAPAGGIGDEIGGYLFNGGQVIAQLNGTTTVRMPGGQIYVFDAGGHLTASYAPGGANGGGSAAGGTATGGRAIGSTVTARTAAGQTITGQVTGVDANGNTIVRWEDGTVATYNPQGQMIDAQPPVGAGGTATGGTTQTGTTTGGGAAARQVGQTVSATTAGGQTLQGQVTDVQQDGTFVVTWSDGQTSYYNAQGQHVTTLAANNGPSVEPRDIAPTDLSTTAPAAPPAQIDNATGGGPKPTGASVQSPDSSIYGAPNPAGPAPGTNGLDPGPIDAPYAGPPSPQYFDAYNKTPTTTAPASSVAPPPLPLDSMMFADAFGNPVTYAQLVASFGTPASSPSAPPSPLQIASTLAAPDISAPTPPLLYPSGSQPAFDAGQFDPPPSPGVTDVAQQPYSGGSYFTE